MTAFDSAFQAAAAVGITVCVASGDNGSSDGVTDGADHVDFQLGRIIPIYKGKGSQEPQFSWFSGGSRMRIIQGVLARHAASDFPFCVSANHASEASTMPRKARKPRLYTKATAAEANYAAALTRNFGNGAGRARYDRAHNGSQPGHPLHPLYVAKSEASDAWYGEISAADARSPAS